MEKSSFEDWVEKYVTAWNSNDPEDIGGLFTDGADYFTEPYAAPWRGRDEIVREWLEDKDEPGETEFSHEIIAVQDNLGFLRGKTVYKTPPRTYENLWEITLDSSGAATRFVEWWMKVPD
jgi:SnoaL-like domain